MKFFLGKRPKFIPRHAKWPDAAVFAQALREFKRKFFCAAYFSGQGSTPSLTPLQLQMHKIRCPSEWWPPTPELVASLFSTLEQCTWDRFRRCWARHRPTSNLSCLDRLALHWLKKNDFTVFKDDKRTALIPVKISFLTQLENDISNAHEKFEQGECDRVSLSRRLHEIIDRLCARCFTQKTREGLFQQSGASWKLMEIILTWKSHKKT